MPFRLPNFNLFCNVYSTTVPGWPPSLPTIANKYLHLPCALVYGRRTNQVASGGTTIQGFPAAAMSLLLPAGYYLQSIPSVGPAGCDIVEVPEGSTLFYGVAYCQPVGSGYPNEHMNVLIVPCPNFWPAF